MSSGGLQLLSQLKLKRPRTSSSSIAQRDREGKEDRGDIPRNRDRDRDILLSPRVSSRLSSANTQVIKIGVESESGDEGMVQEAQDIVEDQGNGFFLEHEQDPDNENHVTSYVHHQSLISVVTPADVHTPGNITALSSSPHDSGCSFSCPRLCGARAAQGRR